MIYFISDAHLGSRVMEDPAAHQQKLVDLLQRMGEDATAIYLLGDIFDYWYEYVWPSSRRTKRELYGKVLSTLRSLTQRGIEIHFFIGNHDIWTFGWLRRETGMIIHRRPMETTICGRSVLLGHGDGLVPSNIMELVPAEFRRRIRHFMLLRRFFHNPIPQYIFRLIPTRWGDEFGYEWARRSRLRELAHPCAYKGENNEELVLFAKEKEQLCQHHDYYIFGHRHIELDLMLPSGSRVVILGDFFQQWTYAQMDEQGNLQLCNAE